MGDNQERDDTAAGIARSEDNKHPSGQAQRGAEDVRSAPPAAQGEPDAGVDGAPQPGDPEAGMQREVGDIAADDPDDGSLPGRMGGGLAGA